MKNVIEKIQWFGADVVDGRAKPPALSPSAEKHLEGLNYGEIYICYAEEDPTIFIRTNTDKIAAFSKKTNIDELRGLFINKDRIDETDFLVRFLDGIECGRFTGGAFGSGACIKIDPETGQSYIEVDRLLVRMKAIFTKLIIESLSHVGGASIWTPARMNCIKVEELEDSYRCYFNSTDGEKTITNDFKVGDQARRQEFNIKPGVHESVSNRYYWRLVVGTGDDYIDLSKTDCDTGSDDPIAGEEIVLLGNRTDKDRQNAIIIDSYGPNAPSFNQYAGINSYSLAGKEVTALSPHGNRFIGDFLSKTGINILTQLEVLEGLFRTEISSIRDEIQKKDNYLFNSAFASNTNGWATTNDVRFLTVDGRTLYFNRNFYSEKRQVADVVRFDAKSVLRIKNSGIRQLNAALSRRPEAGEPDAEDPKFFMSFRYRVMRAGVLSVGFSGQGLWQEVRLEATDDFVDVEYSGTWDGTGDFELRFTGDAYFYSLALTDNAFEDYITKFNTEISQTNERITLLAEKVNGVDGALKSEIDVRAEGIQLLNEKTSAIDGRIDQIGIDINGINNNLWLYVKKGSVISEINISQEQIKINSKNISLEGLTTINGKFRVLEDGSVEGTDVNLTGTITATGGAVGGFKISSSQLLSKSGSNEMLLSSDLIRFTDQYNSVYIGADTYPSEGGGVLSTPIRIHSNRPSQSMANGNIGVHISVEGATVYDDVIYTGNHALYIPKGGICGFRLRMRRVSTSQTLSVMDSVILVQSTQRITLTLPANAEDGQRYEIRNTGSGSFRLAAYGAVKIVGGKSGNATTNDSSSAALHTVIFDKVNLIWWLNWSNCD